ncbi:MAG: hypothetical protein IJD04_07130 [Desulfovibrionaceae bacterium]|nr:hypothetical protein [Desulfovibrionaceae bacterium]
MVAPIIVSVLGVAYCLFVYLGIGESVCVTAGCSLYKSFGIYGISLWIFGIVAFVLLTLLMAAGAYSLSRLFAGICLAGDCALLLLMAATSPCLSCLGVAVLFAVVYLMLRLADTNEQRGNSSLIFVWSLLFVSNLVLSVRELLPPEPVCGSRQAPVHIYFSPSCENCLDAMEQFQFGEGQVAYFAISRNDDDLRMLIALNERLAQGEKMPAALKAVKASSSLPEYSLSRDNLLLQWRLLRNKAVVIERSGGTVPYITINGVPGGGVQPEALRGERLDAEPGSSAAYYENRTDGIRNDAAEAAVSSLPDSGAAGSAGDTGETDGGSDFIFGNATSFETCTDEIGENCD